MKLQRDTIYPCVDYRTLAERKALDSRDQFGHDIAAVWTGEKRPPRKGEWYLSGSIIEAYRAPNDLDTPFHIAKLVRTVLQPSRRVLA